MDTDVQQCQRLDGRQVDATHFNDEEDCSGSYEDDSYTDGEDYSETEGSSEEDDEPVLKYRRFAKEVVDSLSQGNVQDTQTKNVIVCMAIHTKVGQKCAGLWTVLIN